jgi:hypothetical protein
MSLMTYYSMGLQTEVDEILRVTPSLSTAFKRLQVFERFANELFAGDFDGFLSNRSREKSFQKFLAGNPSEKLEKSLYELSFTKDDLKTIKTDDQLYEWIDNRFNLTRGYKAQKTAFLDLLKTVNLSLPLILPSRPGLMEESKVMLVRDRIQKVSDDTFLIYVATNHGNPHLFLLQQCESSSASMTFSSIILLLGRNLKSSYPGRFRSMRFPHSLAWAIGPRYILYRIPKYSLTANTDLLSSAISVGSKADFWALQLRLVRSFAGESFLRDIFSLKQQPEQSVVVSIRHAAFSNIVGDFGIKQPSDLPSMHLTDGLVRLFGPSGRGNLVMATAATAQSFLTNIESVRAWIEMALEERPTEDFEGALDEMMLKRGQIEQKILTCAPPKGPGATPQDSVLWMAHLLKLVDSARQYVYPNDVCWCLRESDS